MVSFVRAGIADMPEHSAHVAAMPPQLTALALQVELALPQVQPAGHVNASAGRAPPAARRIVAPSRKPLRLRTKREEALPARVSTEAAVGCRICT